MRGEIDGFQNTRNWDAAVNGTQNEMGFDGTMDDLEGEINGVEEEEPSYEEPYEP